MPDATQPDQQRQTSAAALLALGIRLNLPALICQHKITPRPFRQIKPTEALRSDLAAPYFAIVRGWTGQREQLLVAYERARSTGDAALIRAAATTAMANVQPIVARSVADFRARLSSVERWHRGQWVQRVKTATGLDVSMMTGNAEVQPEMASATAWNAQLATDVHQQVGHGVSLALMGALAIGAPVSVARARMNAVILRARKRSARIAVDQIDRTVSAMDRARRDAAGLTQFRWHHQDQPHPRPEHLARDGRVYSQANAPNDRAGTLPFCKCYEEPLWT